jgi:dienelactone hydrolase
MAIEILEDAMRYHVPLLIVLFVQARPAFADYPPPVQAKAAFLKLLDRPRVPPDVEVISSKTQAEGIAYERLRFASEKKVDGTVERVPVHIVRPAAKSKRLPAVIVLHGTGGSGKSQIPFCSELAKRGIIGVAIDARYHGERAGGAKGATAYNQAIIRAWRTKSGIKHEHPFYYDTCWDLWRLVDYLETRPDVDAKNLGMIGFSMGGIEAWLAASVDERIKVTVPAIAVQSFRWSLENERWQGRARTIGAAHQAAAQDLGESNVNQKVCRQLWAKIIPGILDDFDCPSLIRLFAGRPLLILSGEKDGNCPIEGARLACAAAEKAYQDAGASDKLRIMVAKGVGHAVTPEQRQAAFAWFERWLK